MSYRHFCSLLLKIQQRNGNSACFRISRQFEGVVCGPWKWYSNDRFQSPLHTIRLNTALPREQQLGPASPRAGHLGVRPFLPGGVALGKPQSSVKATTSVRDKVKTRKHTSAGKIGHRLGGGQSQCTNQDFKAERPESLRVPPPPKAAWGAEGTRGFQGSRLAAPVRSPRNFHLPGTSACVQFFHYSLLLIFVWTRKHRQSLFICSSHLIPDPVLLWYRSLASRCLSNLMTVLDI